MYKLLLSLLFILFIQVNVPAQPINIEDSIETMEETTQTDVVLLVSEPETFEYWLKENKEALLISLVFITIFVWAFLSLRKRDKKLVPKYKTRSLRPWDIIMLSEKGVMQEVHVVSVDIDKTNIENRIITYTKPNSSDKKKFHKITMNQDDEVEWVS